MQLHNSSKAQITQITHANNALWNKIFDHISLGINRDAPDLHRENKMFILYSQWTVYINKDVWEEELSNVFWNQKSIQIVQRFDKYGPHRMLLK